MSGDLQLFTDEQVYTGNPLDPDLDQVCPPSIVASLMRPQREARVHKLIEQAHFIIDQAWELADGRMRAAWAVLFSGGGDSTVLLHLMKHRVDCTFHANTTIGVEETRQFVRDTTKGYGLDLFERTPPETYRELITTRGYPGPAMHWFYYGRLKERALDRIRAEIITHPRRERVLYVAGRRRAESERRADIPLWQLDGSAIWASPMANWTKLDCTTYILMMRDTDDPVPVNEVAQLLHMSAECLCGAFASPGELDNLRMWYPHRAAEIDEHTAYLKQIGWTEPFTTWGHGIQGSKMPAPPTDLKLPSGFVMSTKREQSKKVGRLCTSCQPGLFEGAAS